MKVSRGVVTRPKIKLTNTGPVYLGEWRSVIAKVMTSINAKGCLVASLYSTTFLS